MALLVVLLPTASLGSGAVIVLSGDISGGGGCHLLVCDRKYLSCGSCSANAMWLSDVRCDIIGHHRGY